MSNRSKHLFHFSAAEISAAAGKEAEYHESRRDHWQKEMDAALARMKATASIKVEQVQVAGGWRPEITIEYGDPSAYTRLREAGAKANSHRERAERLRTEERLYKTQGGRVYELDADDVHFYRLNQAPRED
jgi:hypothetical protein